MTKNCQLFINHLILNLYFGLNKRKFLKNNTLQKNSTHFDIIYIHINRKNKIKNIN